MPSRVVDSSVIKIETDHAPALAGFAEVERRGEKLGKTIQAVTRTMGTDFKDFGSIANTAGNILDAVSKRQNDTGSTAGRLAASISTAAATFTPYGLLAAAAAQALTSWYTAAKNAALAAQEAGAKQDTINRALQQGAEQGTNYAGAIEFLNKQYAHMQALNPAAAAEHFLETLEHQKKAAEDADAEHKALAEGLARLGIVQGDAIDIQKQWAEAQEKAEVAAKRLQEANDKLADSLRTIQRIGIDTGAWTMGDLTSVGFSTDDIDHLRDTLAAQEKAAASLRDRLREVQQVGIATTDARWLQNNLGDVGQTTDDIEQLRTALDAVFDDAQRGAREVAGVLAGIPGLLQQAFTGGGGFAGAGKALASSIGSSVLGENGPLGFGAGGLMNGIGNKLAGVFGAGLGLALPGIGGAIGAAIGPLVGKVGSAIKGLFTDEDWEKTNDMRDAYVDAAGGLSALNDKAFAATSSLDLVRKLLDARTPEAYTKAMNELNAAIDHHAQLAQAASSQFGPSQDELKDMAKQAEELYEYMRDAGEYTADQIAAAFNAAQDAAAAAGDTAAAAAVQAREASAAQFEQAGKDLQDLIGQRNSLMQSISSEAPEAVMGVIESQQRGQLAVLDDQIQDKADAYAQLAKDTGKTMSEEIVKALSDMYIQPVHVPIQWDAPSVPGSTTPPIIPMADGGIGRITRPTFFYSGGNEDYAFSGEGRSFNGSGGAGASDRPIDVYVDGEKLWRLMERGQNKDYRLRHKVTRR